MGYAAASGHRSAHPKSDSTGAKPDGDVVAALLPVAPACAAPRVSFTPPLCTMPCSHNGFALYRLSGSFKQHLPLFSIFPPFACFWPVRTKLGRRCIALWPGRRPQSPWHRGTDGELGPTPAPIVRPNSTDGMASSRSEHGRDTDPANTLAEVSQPAKSGDPTALRIALRLAIVIAVVISLVAVATTSRWGLWWRLITFTYQVNLLAAAYYLWTMVSPRADSRVGLRGAVVLYVVLAGVVWNLFLTGHSMGYTMANFLLHVVVPALALADWLLVGRGLPRVTWWHPLAWLLYPAAYLALALLVLNTAGRRAPYFFLDPATVGPGTVAFNIGVLAAAVLAMGYALLAVNRVAATFRADVA